MPARRGGSSLQERRSRPLPAVLALLAFAWSDTSALATDRYFGDLESTSNNGRYAAEAKSPDNADGHVRPFAASFTITFREAGAAVPLWTHVQQKDEIAPVFLLPTDDGYLIVEDAWSHYSVFDTSGKRTVVLRVLDSIFKEGEGRFVERWTSGDFWEPFAIHDFMKSESPPVFFIRTYWGRVFAIDYQSACWLQDPGLEKRIEARVVADTRDWLRAFSGNLKRPCSSCGKDRYTYEVGIRLCVVRLHGIPEGLKYVDQVLAAPDDGHWPKFARHLSRVPAGHDVPPTEPKPEFVQSKNGNQAMIPEPDRDSTSFPIFWFFAWCAGSTVGLVLVLYLIGRAR